MVSTTRIIRGKMKIVPATGLAPDPFPLAKLLGGRRRVPSQARSLRTRKEILDASIALATEHGPGAVTMQMVAQRAGIAAGTAYQFFEDRDAIFFEIYEAWAAEFWSRLMLVTTTTWTEANWRELLHAHSNAISRFYYESRSLWSVVRYVESTKFGRVVMKALLDANLERRMKVMAPLFRESGHSAEETRRIVKTLVRIARGHLAYAEMSPSDMRELSLADEETQSTVIEAKLSNHPTSRPGSGAARARAV